MDTLKEQKNRGYVIAGIGGIVAFIAFFLPYVSLPGYGSLSGSTIGGWLFFQLLASLVAIAIPLALIYRHNAFGLTNMPVDKQIRYGIFTLIGAGAVGLLAELILAANHSSLDGLDLTGPGVGLGFGWWVFLLSAIAILVGGVMALRNPQTMGAQGWQYPATQYPYNQSYPPQPTQYPPYPTIDQPPYPPYPPQYPPVDPQQYQPTELKPYPQTGPQQYAPTEPGQQYGPTELRPNPQTGPQPYPDTGPQPQPQPYPPTELPSPPYPQQQQYPPPQMPPA